MRKDVEKNNIDEKILELGNITWTYDEKQETLEKIKNTPTKRNLPIKYYLAIASVCLLTLILLSPMLLQFIEENNEASLTIKDFADLSDIEFSVIYWIDEEKGFERRINLDNKDERLIELSDELQELELTDSVGIEIGYNQTNNHLIGFVHSEKENSFTTFTLYPNGEITVLVKRDLLTEKLTGTNPVISIYEKVDEIIKAEKKKVDNTTAGLVDLCGWDPNRTIIVLEDNYTHPIPCIQPVLGPTSMIMVQSSREGEEFIYRETEENKPEQVVSVAIVGKDSKIAGAKNIIKETADYHIFEQTQLSNGEDDVSIVAEGYVNEELNFQISFHDRNGDYKLEEIVSKIEGIINDIRRNQ